MDSQLSEKFFYGLPILFEGNSRIIKSVPKKNYLLCQLKSTVFSFIKGSCYHIKGIDFTRASLNSLFCNELHKNGICTSTLETSGRIIKLKLEEVAPIEVIVKSFHIGSPKHLYLNMDKTLTVNNTFLYPNVHHEPYIRFDWRNPLPKEDYCMPEGLANHFIDVEKAKMTAFSAYQILSLYCAKYYLKLKDICFFMNKEGNTICAEISTDNTRIDYFGKNKELHRFQLIFGDHS